MDAPLDPLDYHQLTKHSLYSVRTSTHFLDWENQPLPFKVYSHIEPVPLPQDFDDAPRGVPAPGLPQLARLLFYTAGITRVRTYIDGYKQYFRAAACTGALYHIDLYVACGDLEGLAAGVYHFAPDDFALRLLRAGDHRRILADASGNEPALATAPVVVVFASTFWRNAWKYQSRAYRHCFWDTGTMLANTLAVAAEDRIPARIVAGFADAPVNELLGLDGRREAAIACLAIGAGDTATAAPPLASLDLATQPLSGHEIDYPTIRAAHDGSSIADAASAAAWRQNVRTTEPASVVGSLQPLGPTIEPPRTVTAAIRRRGSARRFARTPIRTDQLACILRSATAPIAADFYPNATSAGDGRALLGGIYLIVNAVDGLTSGNWFHRPTDDAVELLREGELRGDAGHLDLGQELAADAAVNFYVLTDLESIAGRLGPRGYRAASLEAAIIGGRIYLAAYRLGLGATGLTFFDDDVTDFFSPHAGGREVLFLTAVGHPARSA